MGSVIIKPGLIVLWEGQQWEIRAILSADEVELVNFSTGVSVAVKIGELEFTIKPAGTPQTVLDDDFDYYEQDPVELGKARKRYVALARLVREDGKVDVGKAARALKLSKAQVYRLLQRFDPGEGFNTLLRRKPGKRLGARLLRPAVEAVIQEVIIEEFKGQGLCYQKIFEHVRGRCTNENLPVPSLKAVTERVKSRTGRELTKQKYGKEVADQRHGAKPYHYDVERPLQVVQIDHTPVDIIVCDEDTRQPLCRPWVTMAIDVFTRVVLGFFLSLSCPSRHVVATCVTHAVLPKTKWLKRIGDDSINYPYFGKPEAIHVDNASEFRSRDFRWACSKNSIHCKFRKRKHYGGHIERLIGTFMGRVHFLPGTTFSNVVIRGDYDSEKKSAMTFQKFLIWFTREVERYHLTEHSELNMSPADKWREYFTDESGAIHVPPIVENSATFRVDFLPSEFRVIHPAGVLINSQVYWSESLRPYVGIKNALVKYDPESIYQVWVRVDKNRYIETPCRDLSTEDCTLYEWKKRRRTMRRRPSKADTNRADELSSKNRTLVDSEVKATKEARINAERKKARGFYVEPPNQKKELPHPIDYSIEPTGYLSSSEEDE